MKRTHFSIPLTAQAQQDVFLQTAFHEAGHAVAICLRNQYHQLPPVYFHIILESLDVEPSGRQYLAKVEGGQLISSLPASLAYLPVQQKDAYLDAFEADIVNLLAGPLAEAKYIALRDDEPLNPDVVNLNALAFYGGESDLEVVQQYIHCFIENMQQRRDKVELLFKEAFHFINNRQHWKIIADLANYIIRCQKTRIPCEEVLAVIDASLQVSTRRH